jgi:hypothetical protein
MIDIFSFNQHGLIRILGPYVLTGSSPGLEALSELG